MSANILKPTVSIGMPVYNGGKYIKEAIDSLLAQTFKDFELIISDNCSTDGTEAICLEYTKNDKRVRYVKQSQNIGASKNFEFVLQESKGEFFMWAAHDDRWSPDCINKLTLALKQSEDAGLAFSNYTIRNLETSDERLVVVCPRDSKIKAFNYLLGIFDMCPSMIYGLYKTALIRDTKFKSFDFADVSFISELGLRAKIIVLSDFLYIAGIKGERTPYSFTPGKIKRMPFLKKQYVLLKQYFSFPVGIVLFLCTCIFMGYNKIRLWRF
jgi:glycosyltransferase involved in cell wall biosynthesis